MNGPRACSKHIASNTWKHPSLAGTLLRPRFGFGLSGLRHRLHGLLSRPIVLATGKEVSHSRRRLLCSGKVLSKTVHRRAEEASGRHWGEEESSLVCVFDLHQIQPQVVLQHHQTDHCSANSLGWCFHGSQGQVSRTVKLLKLHSVRAGLVYGTEELLLKELCDGRSLLVQPRCRKKDEVLGTPLYFVSS